MSVTNKDLYDLLTILYQGSVRKFPTASIPVYSTGALFFLKEDIQAIAETYGFPLPSAGIDNTLRVGLTQGVFARSIQNGSQCGFSICDPKGASYLAFKSDGSGPGNQNTNRIVDSGVDISGTPVFIYAYNPNMLKVNSKNMAVLNESSNNSNGSCSGHSLCQSYYKVSGSYVKYANNRAPCYQYRGWGSTSNNPFGTRSGSSQTNRCCRK